MASPRPCPPTRQAPGQISSDEWNQRRLPPLKQQGPGRAIGLPSDARLKIEELVRQKNNPTVPTSVQTEEQPMPTAAPAVVPGASPMPAPGPLPKLGDMTTFPGWQGTSPIRTMPGASLPAGPLALPSVATPGGPQSLADMATAFNKLLPSMPTTFTKTDSFTQEPTDTSIGAINRLLNNGFHRDQIPAMFGAQAAGVAAGRTEEPRQPHPTPSPAETALGLMGLQTHQNIAGMQYGEGAHGPCRQRTRQAGCGSQ